MLVYYRAGSGFVTTGRVYCVNYGIGIITG